MDFLDVVQGAFSDELEKISGSLHGKVRSGRRPIGAQRLMEKDSQHTKVSDIVKLSSGGGSLLSKIKSPAGKLGVAAIGGAGAYHVGRQMNEDRKLGRQLRIQQQT